MSATVEQDEGQELDLSKLDAIHIAVGCGHCVTNHRIDAHIDFGGGSQSGRLRVSRYYWDLEPPVAIDFVRDLHWGEDEVAAKKIFFEKQKVRYVLARDVFDGEGVEAALARFAEPEAERPRANQKKPVTGPRRRRTQTKPQVKE